MKLTLDKNIRLRQRETSYQIEENRKKISIEINRIHEKSSKALYEHRDELYKIERDFVEDISVFFKNKSISLGTKVRVIVQVGPNGGDIIREHIGTIELIYDTRRPCFDLSDPNYLDGKNFTIGSSCIQEIEIL